MTETTTVCVTGVTGYIASHIALQLLEQGFHVRGTVRALADAGKYDFLVKLAEKHNASERLTFVEADLLKQGSFDAAFAGCKYVLHTASPFIIGKIEDPQKTFIEPAVEGTANVLASVAKNPSVERVVLTSSVASIWGDIDVKGPEHVFSEADWNETSTLAEGAYSLSKVTAEKKAWEIANAQSAYKLVVINPGFVMGPTLSGRDDSASVSFLREMLSGKLRTGVPALTFAIVDVRDVAAAHIAAMLKPDAQGRYLCAKEAVPIMGIAQALKPTYAAYPLPAMVVPKFLMYLVGPLLADLTWHFISHNIGHSLRFDNSKIVKDLGITFARTTQATLQDMAQSLIDFGLVDRK